MFNDYQRCQSCSHVQFLCRDFNSKVFVFASKELRFIRIIAKLWSYRTNAFLQLFFFCFLLIFEFLYSSTLERKIGALKKNEADLTASIKKKFIENVAHIYLKKIVRKVHFKEFSSVIWICDDTKTNQSQRTTQLYRFSLVCLFTGKSNYLIKHSNCTMHLMIFRCLFSDLLIKSSW